MRLNTTKVIGNMTSFFLQFAATGMIDGGTNSGSLMELLLAETDVGKRKDGVNNGAIAGTWLGKVRWHPSLGGMYPLQEELELAWWYLADIYHLDNVKIRLDVPAKPSGISVNAGTITADDPGDDCELWLLAWDFEEFTLVGKLAENNHAPAGNYVLVNGGTGGYSLPSAFFEVT